MKSKPVYITLEDDKRNIIERIPMTEADDDWLRAARLSRKAQEGDKVAAEELKRMQESPMMKVVDDDEDDDEDDNKGNCEKSD